ncbi:MAG TPA: S8 family peptidase [Jatrophihabitans sp.]|jgi:subtilisin family serine protease|uniref:S8 family peptidase n=1 Tax=Jatrophihabitans sp. TaxID=1932789 RepID=UPI002EF269FD
MRRSLPLLCAATMALSAFAVSVPGHAAVPANSPSAASTNAAAKSVANELVVGYVSGAAATDRARARDKVAARLAQRVVTASGARAEVELVRLPAGADQARAMRELKADPSVAYAEPNWVYTHAATATDPYYTNGSLWGMYGPNTTPANAYGSNAAAAWAAGQTGSSSVYVGIIDEGIQYTHPDLAGQVGNPLETANGVDDDGNGYVDDVYGWDFAGNDSSVYDGGTRGSSDDHGTHVSGTIGAKANNGAGVVGVNWNVRLISGKFLGRNGGTLANAVLAVDYFTGLKARGVNIVATNNSWGGGGFSQALMDAIERANRANILFIAAAGNGGSDQVGDNNDVTAHYPSTYTNSNVIAVAAITSTGTRASWSNYGATSVDIGAPGAAIWSSTAYNIYESYSGTSMATPHVTGAAALYASTHPGATAAAIKNALLSSAVPTASMSGITTTGGRLDAFAAMSK